MDIEAKVILRKTGKANLIQTFFIISFGYQSRLNGTNEDKTVVFHDTENYQTGTFKLHTLVSLYGI